MQLFIATMKKVNIWYTPKSELLQPVEFDDSLDVNLDSFEREKFPSELLSFEEESMSSDTENSLNVPEISFENEDSTETLSKQHFSEMKELNENVSKPAQKANLIRKIDEKKEDSPQVPTGSKESEELNLENFQLNEQSGKSKLSKFSVHHYSKFLPSIKYLNRKIEKFDSGDLVKFRRPSLMFAPIFQDQMKLSKPKKIKRYTVDQAFYDHWINKSKMDENKLKSILKLWASDNWEGLYDPPEWLTAGMFIMALTDEPSNKKKVEKLIKAKEYLEMAKRTNSKMSVKAVKSSSSNEPNKKSARNIGLMMRNLLKKTKDLDKKTKSFELKNECISTVENTLHDWKDEMDSHKMEPEATSENLNLNIRSV